jgi:histone deacetylase 1/2
MLGGGGYTIKNVARCWANETAICLGIELDDELPLIEYMDKLGKDPMLHFDAKLGVENENTRQYIEYI